MTLKIVYFSNNSVHKQIFTNVNHWYYSNGHLVIKGIDVSLEESNVVLLDSESWLPNK